MLLYSPAYILIALLLVTFMHIRFVWFGLRGDAVGAASSLESVRQVVPLSMVFVPAVLIYELMGGAPAPIAGCSLAFLSGAVLQSWAFSAGESGVLSRATPFATRAGILLSLVANLTLIGLCAWIVLDWSLTR